MHSTSIFDNRGYICAFCICAALVCINSVTFNLMEAYSSLVPAYESYIG